MLELSSSGKVNFQLLITMRRALILPAFDSLLAAERTQEFVLGVKTSNAREWALERTYEMLKALKRRNFLERMAFGALPSSFPDPGIVLQDPPTRSRCTTGSAETTTEVCDAVTFGSSEDCCSKAEVFAAVMCLLRRT